MRAGRSSREFVGGDQEHYQHVECGEMADAAQRIAKQVEGERFRARGAHFAALVKCDELLHVHVLVFAYGDLGAGSAIVHHCVPGYHLVRGSLRFTAMGRFTTIRHRPGAR